jgi:ribosomal protein S12 methylthiotransferase accessory factor
MGKGATPEQAKASAIMELAERFSFFSFSKNPENFFVEKHVNLKDRALSFDLIARSVHDRGEELEITRKIYENLPLKWTRAFNLTRNEPVYIPFDWFYAINEFNGPSAGNCVEEALSQGICELVERHVSSIISHEKLPVSAIRPYSADDPMVVEMIQKYKQAGIQLYLSDFSLDLGIPSVGALAYDPATFPKSSEIVWTAGTTPDPQKALSRALTEVAQLAGDFNSNANYVASGLPKFKTVDEAAFIIDVEEQKDISQLPDISDNNIRKEVENLISALHQKQMEVITIETTHPLLEIPAFYTIIPGAHFRERALGTSVGMFSAKLIAENQHPRKALETLSDIDRRLPGKYYVKFYMGLCHQNLDAPEAALGYLEQALELDPKEQDIPSIYSYMGVSLKDMNRYEEALEVLARGKDLDQDRTDIYNLMGFCHFKLGEHEKAIEDFQKVLALDPASAIDYANIASNYRELGQREKAIRYYQIALELDPSIEFARENLDKLQH